MSEVRSNGILTIDASWGLVVFAASFLRGRDGGRCVGVVLLAEKILVCTICCGARVVWDIVYLVRSVGLSKCPGEEGRGSSEWRQDMAISERRGVMRIESVCDGASNHIIVSIFYVAHGSEWTVLVVWCGVFALHAKSSTT